MKILVDYREYKCGIYHLFKSEKEVDVEYTNLDVGDYLVDEKLIVERKTLIDFASSIKDGRLFRQAGKLVNHKAKPLIILEGSIDSLKFSSMKREAIQGALINLNLILGIPILRSKSTKESVKLMIYAGRQANSIRRGPVLRKGKRPKEKKAKQLALFQALPGVGAQRAMVLLDRFTSLKKLTSASLEELCEVEGIGVKTASEIYSILHEPTPVNYSDI